ncbi:hypothetical protein [Haloarchaeobius litoreus]|uniref:Uncharacterized protein n=1 Tax=Haloarchaeobius litoreus TaxID=755306 RepID=A0ABD6DP57_9EURY|nr:hypothetical protein [Haloarchaeobius litoreus]
MSNKDSFEAQLHQMYDRYRREHLRERLDVLAQTMEETLLQQTVASAFFDETVRIDDDVKSDVEATVAELEAGEYDAVDEKLDALEADIQGVETRVSNRIQELRIAREDTVRAMRRLNERVDRVDSSQVAALESLLEQWDWKPQVYLDEHNTFESRRKEAEQYGSDMSMVFEMLKDDLFGVYDGTELRPIVDRLLDDERFELAQLTPTERQQLAESDLADYVELRLS